MHIHWLYAIIDTWNQCLFCSFQLFFSREKRISHETVPFYLFFSINFQNKIQISKLQWTYTFPRWQQQHPPSMRLVSFCFKHITISPNDKDIIKNNLVELMCSCTLRPIQMQISEAINVIASSECIFLRFWHMMCQAWTM